MKHSTVPDAWDEDWEVQADSAANDEDNKTEHDGETSLQPTPSLTKAERITKHCEANRKVWEFA